jgi:protein gp37
MPAQYAYPFSVIQMFESRLDWPLHVKTPNRVFVNSMSDLFHNKIDPSFRREVFAVMKRAHWHTFQILTKRGNGLQKLADKLEWSPNIWIGVSVENDLFTARVDQLRRVPAAVRFLSCEPLLGPLPSLNLEGIHWVITGGESGANARFCDPAWVRAIRDKCVSEGVAYFHKQWGGRTSKAGGRDLDGRTWDQFPEQPAQVANI